MEVQVVELLGRNRLVSDLVRAGLEVALPVRDHGVDLVAYADLGATVKRFAARPIQMKSGLRRSFSVDRKYARIRDLIIAYVWSLNEPGKEIIYAFSYPQAVRIAEKMGYTKTASWKKGNYVNTRPSGKLISLLAPYEMNPQKWWEMITGTQKA